MALNEPQCTLKNKLRNELNGVESYANAKAFEQFKIFLPWIVLILLFI